MMKRMSLEKKKSDPLLPGVPATHTKERPALSSKERPALARRPYPSLSSGCGAGGAPSAPVAYCTIGCKEAISNTPRAARRARLVSRGGSRRLSAGPPRRRIAAGIDRLAGTPARAPPTAAARPS